MRHIQLSVFVFRDLLKQFTTMELMRWASLVEDYGKELREGSPDSPATEVFSYTEEGEKRWKDLKNRVVEHVSPIGKRIQHIEITVQLKYGHF